ncbi:UPAR/Ly6 domain-containing protein rtv [Anabrus simplex]|uniref:UPAR/Ly6 domain-containing protein rtv n=1 Tax=Anabrus simplex TaxID=316456 RepID=UPI0035A32C4A
MKQTKSNIFIPVIFFVLSLPYVTEGLLKRCYACRSRGDLGSCKDPFKFNSTLAEKERGVDAVPCASGWCGKFLEGGTTYKQDDYGIATQRLCLQRGPSDDEERCAYTDWNHKKVYMCFCLGDLCNSSPVLSVSIFIIMFSVLVRSLT